MSTTSHTEIEQKYEAGPEVTLPSSSGLGALDGVGGVEDPEVVELVATYHDTADLRLLHSGVTLRRRTGGGDEGWHLKLPEALDERLELHRPLGRSTRPPRQLAELVTATARREALTEVATIRTRRTIRRLVDVAGAPLVELADDMVEGEIAGAPPVRWREIEVEAIVDHARPLLELVGELVVAAGATRSNAASKAARVFGGRLTTVELDPGGPDETAGGLVLTYLREQRSKLVALDPLVRRDVPDSVHKMRVAARRLRSALRTHRRLLDRSVTDPLRAELKWLGGELGKVRDAEVIMARLVRLLDREPHHLVLGPVRRRIRSTFATEQRTARRNLLGQLGSERYLDLLDALDGVAAGTALRASRAAKSAKRQARKSLRREHERWLRRVDHARALHAAGVDEHMDEALHDVRKASKRLRYGAESAEPAFGYEATALAAAMEAVQEVLGEHQDTVVTRAVLRRLAGAADAAGEITFTWGRLHALEQIRAEACAARFLEGIDEIRATLDWLN